MAQFAVLHVSKGKSQSGGLTAHIERKVKPKNCNVKLTKENIHKDYSHLGKTLGQRADQVIKNSGITRKVRTDAVKFNPIIISGSHDQMKKIQEEGNLDKWTEDAFKLVKEEFGEENIISFAMHADETTPHVHAVIVPIVPMEEAERVESEQGIKRKKKKKNPDKVRLSSKILFRQENLVKLQDKVALKMMKWGFQRGIKGSRAKHEDLQVYYKRVSNPVATELNVKAKTSYFKADFYEVDKEVLDKHVASTKGFQQQNEHLKVELNQVKKFALSQMKTVKEFEGGKMSPLAVDRLNKQLKAFDLVLDKEAIKTIAQVKQAAKTQVNEILKPKNPRPDKNQLSI